MKRVQLIYLNATFWLLFPVFTAGAIVVLTLFVSVCAVFMPHRKVMRRFRRAISWYGLGVIRVLPFPLIRVDYQTCELPPGEGPFIFVSNHRSLSDAFLMACLPYECVQVAKTWPLRLPVFGAFGRWAGYISVQEMAFEEFIQRGMELLRAGCSLVCFPEGTRSGSRKMGQFYGGVFRLALRARRPIIPLCLSGNENVPPRGSLLLRPTRIRVRMLPAFQWESYGKMTPFQLKNRVRSLIADGLSTVEEAHA